MDLAISYIIEGSIKLKCNVEIRDRALLFYHLFVKDLEEEDEIDYYMLSAALLLLSSKFCNCVIDFDELVLVFYSMANRTLRVLLEDDPLYLSLKRCIVVMEQIVLRKFRFNLMHPLAHQYLVHFLLHLFANCSQLAHVQNPIAQTAVRFVNDFYLVRDCIRYKAHHIAIIGIECALATLKVIEIALLPRPWYRIFGPDLTETIASALKQSMFSVYQIAPENRLHFTGPIRDDRPVESPLPEPFYEGYKSDVSVDDIISPELSPARDSAVPARDPSATEKKSAVPARDLTVPEKKSAVPEKKSAVPEKKSAVPEKKSAVPEKKSAVPEKKSAVPEKKSAVSEKKSAVPEKKSAGPEKKSAGPEKKSAVSEKNLAFSKKNSAISEKDAVVLTKYSSAPAKDSAVLEKDAAKSERDLQPMEGNFPLEDRNSPQLVFDEIYMECMIVMVQILNKLGAGHYQKQDEVISQHNLPLCTEEEKSPHRSVLSVDKDQHNLHAASMPDYTSERTLNDSEDNSTSSESSEDLAAVYRMSTDALAQYHNENEDPETLLKRSLANISRYLSRECYKKKRRRVGKKKLLRRDSSRSSSRSYERSDWSSERSSPERYHGDLRISDEARNFGTPIGEPFEEDSDIDIIVEGCKPIKSEDPLEGTSKTFQSTSKTFEGTSKTFEGTSKTFEGKSKTFKGKSKTLKGKSKTFKGKSKTFEGTSKTFLEKCKDLNLPSIRNECATNDTQVVQSGTKVEISFESSLHRVEEHMDIDDANSSNVILGTEQCETENTVDYQVIELLEPRMESSSKTITSFKDACLVMQGIQNSSCEPVGNPRTFKEEPITGKGVNLNVTEVEAGHEYDLDRNISAAMPVAVEHRTVPDVDADTSDQNTSVRVCVKTESIAVEGNNQTTTEVVADASNQNIPDTVRVNKKPMIVETVTRRVAEVEEDYLDKNISATVRVKTELIAVEVETVSMSKVVAEHLDSNSSSTVSIKEEHMEINM